MSAESVPVQPNPGALPKPFKVPPRTLTDFDDRISPMVVKELRQGLRNRVFVVAFLALHSILVLNVLATIADNTRWGSGGFFWGCITFALAWLLPARNLSALSDEVKHRTLDTLVLTRLSAWRIVAGKWASTAAQILLLGISVIPYLIMRYLALGVDLPGELTLLGLTLLAGLAFAAVVTGLSATGSWLARTLLVLIIGGFLMGSLPELARTGAMQSAGGPLAMLLQAVGPAAWLTVLALGGGAAAIAPVAENHATLRRLVTLGMLVAAVIAIRLETGLLAAFATPALITGMLLGLADAPNHLPVIHAPFVRRGGAGRLAALLFTPGPSGGLLYALLLGLIWLWGVGAFDPASAPLFLRSFFLMPKSPAAAWFFVASLLLPALLLCAARPAWRWRGVVYFLVLIILGALGIVMETWGSNENLPTLRMLALGTPGSLRNADPAAFSPAIALAGCWTALLLLALRKEFAHAREMRRLVSEHLHLV